MLAERSAVGRPHLAGPDATPAWSVWALGSPIDAKCHFCDHGLDPHDPVLWIPGIDLPVHEACLEHEISVL